MSDSASTRPEGAAPGVLIPATPLLLPEYASLLDPIADLRACVAQAMSTIQAASHLGIVREDAPLAARLSEHLLEEYASRAQQIEPGEVAAVPGAALLVLADGSAARDLRAPGHLHEGAADFDAAVGDALRAGRGFGELDWDFARTALRCGTASVWPRWAALVEGIEDIEISYDDAPYGVQYWVAQYRVVQWHDRRAG